MALTTQRVLDLVSDALANMPPPPYGEDIILEVSRKIRDTPELRQRYEQLKGELKKDVVNNWIGMHTKNIVGMNTIRQVPATSADIIGSYTKLSRLGS